MSLARTSIQIKQVQPSTQAMAEMDVIAQPRPNPGGR
jgi:hypothetical protein